MELTATPTSAGVTPTSNPAVSSSADLVFAPSAIPSVSPVSPTTVSLTSSTASSAQVQNTPTTTAAVTSAYTAPPLPPPSSTPTPAPETSSPPPAPAPSSAAAPASSPSPEISTDAGTGLPIGVTYDPFTGSDQNTRCKTANEVADEFSRMSSYKNVRIYGMGCNIIPLAVQNAQKNGQTIMGGAYLSNKGNGEDLNAVITTWKNTIDEDANGSWDILKLFSVENERVNDHDMTASEVVDAIRRARDQLRSVGYDGPVGAVDTVPATVDNPSICQASDVVMVNCHPFFDQNTAADDAGTFLKGQIERVKSACKTNRVVITETGWPHQGDANGKAVPSPENQAKALASIRSEFSSDVFIHNSFDSLWKTDWAGSFDAERYWGVIQ